MSYKMKKNERIDISVMVECIGCKRREVLHAPLPKEEPICQFCYLPMAVKAASGKRIKRP